MCKCTLCGHELRAIHAGPGARTDASPGQRGAAPRAATGRLRATRGMAQLISLPMTMAPTMRSPGMSRMSARTLHNLSRPWSAVPFTPQNCMTTVLQ